MCDNNVRSGKMGYNKRLAAGLVLAGVLLVAFCLYAEGHIERESRLILDDVQLLAENVAAEDGEAAVAQLSAVQEHWQQARRVWLGLLSHREVWNIDEVMIRLGVALSEEKWEAAREELGLAEYYLERAYLSDEVNWSNFF